MASLRGFWKDPEQQEKENDVGRTKSMPVLTYLWVPYEEREPAKAAGARWDPAMKQWYVKDMSNPGPYLKWMSPPVKRASIKIARGD